LGFFGFLGFGVATELDASGLALDAGAALAVGSALGSADATGSALVAALPLAPGVAWAADPAALEAAAALVLALAAAGAVLDAARSADTPAFSLLESHAAQAMAPQQTSTCGQCLGRLLDNCEMRCFMKRSPGLDALAERSLHEHRILRLP
jgi:hypothetical protein